MTTTNDSRFRDLALTMALNEPIEIRIRWHDSDRNGLYHLVASVSDSGCVRYSLSRRGAGVPNSLDNLQSKAPFPGKAVEGWQAEVVAFAAGGLGTIVEVR